VKSPTIDGRMMVDTSGRTRKRYDVQLARDVDLIPFLFKLEGSNLTSISPVFELVKQFQTSDLANLIHRSHCLKRPLATTTCAHNLVTLGQK